LISNSFYRQVYYPIVHSTIRCQFCLFINSSCYLSGFICIILLTYLFIYLLNYSMVQSPSWAANSFAASQEIPLISRNPKVHYRTQKCPPPASILGQPHIFSYTIVNSSVLGVFENCETRLLASSYCVSVCLFTWNNSAPTRQILVKFDIWVFSEYMSGEFQRLVGPVYAA